MNALDQNCGPWYENEGPTPEEMKQEIKDKFLKNEKTYYFIWRKKKPYLYLKAINEVVEKCDCWPLASWRGWYSIKDNKDEHIILLADKKYNKLLKALAMKKLNYLLIPYVTHRLYRFPDGLRIKHIRESFYQGTINKYINKID